MSYWRYFQVEGQPPQKYLVGTAVLRPAPLRFETDESGQTTIFIDPPLPSIVLPPTDGLPFHTPWGICK